MLTSPVIRTLKTQVQNAEVHYCTKAKFHTLVSSNPYIDKVHLLENDLSGLLQLLKKENFDYIIDLHNNPRTFLIKKSLGKKSFSFKKLNLQKWLLVNFKINRLPKLHIVDRYMETIKSFGVRNDGKGLDFFIPEKDQITLNMLPPTHHAGYAAFAIGAQHGTKKLPRERIVELCQKLNLPIVLLGDEKDKLTADYISENLKSIPVYNACGMYNLNQSASLLQHSKFVLSHDTGLMHIASALKKKIISIWGSTVPEFGMYPYQTAFSILENKGLKCRPCSKIGYEKCPQGHFNCMKNISFEKISIE